MADKKISQLTSLAQGDIATTTDVLAIVDTSATETKKATPAAIVGAAAAAGLTNVDINSGAIDGTTIGANSAAAGTFTNLTASGTVSFSGATVSNGGSVTTVDINGGTIDGASVGANSASSGAFTTLSASGNVTLSGGTANGVLYLNGSKVATSGSALTFDGTNFATTGNANLGSGSKSTDTQLNFASDLGTQRIYLDRGTRSLVFYDATSAIENYRIAGITGIQTWGVGGSEQMRLTSTGLGIGTTSPTAAASRRGVVLRGNSNGAEFILQSTSASDGTSDGFALIATGSDSTVYNRLNGYMAFGTNNIERMRLDSSGNLGLGVTPSAWDVNKPAFDIGSYGAVYSVPGVFGIGTASNSYYNGTNWIYKSSQYAQAYYHGGGNHVWLTAPFGTAGNAISFTQAMTLDASGNLGLGVTPSAWSGWGVPVLQLSNAGTIMSSNQDAYFGANWYYASGTYRYIASSFASYYSQIAGSHRWYTAPSGTAGNAISFTQAMTLDASGNLLVGTTTGQTAARAVFEGGNVRVRRTSGIDVVVGDNTANALVGTISNHALLFLSNDTERARITAGGILLVGATGQIQEETGLGVQAAQTVGGSGIVTIRNTSSSSADASPPLVISKAMTTTTSSARFVQFYANNNLQAMGGIVGNGAENVQFATISDVREKTNIQPISGSLEKIAALKPVSFDWIKSGEHVKAGFVAQDVEQVFPEFVVENMANDGEEARKGLTGGMTGGIIAHLVAAIKEQQAMINELKAEMAALKGA